MGGTVQQLAQFDPSTQDSVRKLAKTELMGSPKMQTARDFRKNPLEELVLKSHL
jgi:hypothetical protein